MSVDRQDISDAWSVELVFEEVGFQGRGLFRFQAILERPSWYVDCLRQTACFREILGIV